MASQPLVRIPDLTLTKLGFPEIDKICPADFVKKNFKSTATKKDFAFFVSENEDFRHFLEQLEGDFLDKKEEYRDMIGEYLESISDDVLKFLNELKEKKRLKKIQEKQIQEKLIEDRIRAKIYKEIEDKKKKTELEAKLNISPKSEETDKLNENNKPKETKTSKIKTTTTTIKAKLKNKIPVPHVDASQIQITLSDLFKALRTADEQKLIIIKTDNGPMNIRYIDLEDGKIQIKVEEN